MEKVPLDAAEQSSKLVSQTRVVLKTERLPDKIGSLYKVRRHVQE